MRFRVVLLALLLSAGVAVGDPGNWHGGPARSVPTTALPATLNTTLLAPMSNQAMSLVFDGAFEMISITTEAAGFVSTFSFAIWAKNTAAVPSGADGLISVKEAGAPNNFNLSFFVNSDVDIQMNIANDTPATRQLRTWSDAIADDDWHFYVMTWDGAGSSDSLLLYVDSVLDTVDVGGIDADDTGIIDSARNIIIGGVSTGGARFNGPIYYAAIWAAELAQAEIDSLYNGGAPLSTNLLANFGGYVSDKDLIHWYRLGLGTTEEEFGTDHAGTRDLLTTVRVLDETDLTTDIPQ